LRWGSPPFEEAFGPDKELASCRAAIISRRLHCSLFVYFYRACQRILKGSVWLDIYKEPIRQYFPASAIYEHIAKNPPTFARAYTNSSESGYYDSRCQAKINAKNPAQGVYAFPEVEIYPDQKCILATYIDSEFVGYQTQIHWYPERLWQSFLFRISLLVSLFACVGLGFFRLAWLPLIRWIREG
jgi:hypothetical protein